MKDRKVKLNGTVLAGQTLYNLQRTPDVILGDDAGYVRGDILDANAVLTKIDDVIGGAPEIFDTLKEFADALDDDPNLVKDLKTKVGHINTYTHLYHPGNGNNRNETWWADEDNVYLQYFCMNVNTGGSREHTHDDDMTQPIPVVNEKLAGILTATQFNDIEYLLSTLSDKVHAIEATNGDLTKFAAVFTIPAPVAPATLITTSLFNNPNLLASIEVDGVEYTGSDIFSHYTVTDTEATVHHVKYTLIDLSSINSSCWAGLVTMTDFVFANNVQTLLPYTLSLTQMSELYIPDNITTIESGSFGGCVSLRKITIPNTILSITPTFLAGANLNEIVFKNTESAAYLLIDGCFICKSDNSLIAGTNTAVIPSGVEKICAHSFSGRKTLSKIIIPASVSNIEYDVFESTPGITQINVDNNNTTYDSRNNCNAIIETATNTLVAGCKNTIIPNSVVIIGQLSFYGNGITNIVIPDSVTTIGQSSFGNNGNLTEINLNSVTSIGQNAFNLCGLTQIDIPDTVTTIGSSAFQHNDLVSVNIGSGITNIGNSAFSQNYNLLSVTITATTPPTAGNTIFNYAHSSLKIYVPADSVDAYKAASGWSTYASKIEAIPED